MEMLKQVDIQFRTRHFLQQEFYFILKLH